MVNFSLLIGILIIIAAVLIAVFSKRLNLNKDLYIKLSFALLLVTSFCYLLTYWTSSLIVVLLGSLSLYSIFAFVILHSSKTLGNQKTLIFFIIAFSLGLLSEVLSIQSGAYSYNIPTFFFGLVPLEIPISWTIIIYICYTISNLFLFGFGGEKPKRTDNLWYFIGLMVLISSIGGLIAANLSMFIEPVSSSPLIGEWTYLNIGPYFGVPISVITGWFLVSTIAILIFRCYEVFSISSKESTTINKPLYLYIIILYLIYLIFDAFKALKIGKIEYILIGVTTMAPFILIGLLALLSKKSDKK
jgi:putative membrane protein